MPGFTACGQGFTGFGGQPSNVLESRRNHRWVFTTIGRGQGTFTQKELLVLKTASRPKFTFKPAEMHHNQEVSKFAGKQEWEPIELSWYDIEQDPDVSKGLYHWLETVVHLNTANVSHPRFYKRQASLAMIDGMGVPTETWSICGSWPESVDWGKLDYQNNELSVITAKMTFDRAMRSCLTAQPQFTSPTCPAG